jgi:hypothetical protein
VSTLKERRRRIEAVQHASRNLTSGHGDDPPADLLPYIHLFYAAGVARTPADVGRLMRNHPGKRWIDVIRIEQERLQRRHRRKGWLRRFIASFQKPR